MYWRCEKKSSGAEIIRNDAPVIGPDVPSVSKKNLGYLNFNSRNIDFSLKIYWRCEKRSSGADIFRNDAPVPAPHVPFLSKNNLGYLYFNSRNIVFQSVRHQFGRFFATFKMIILVTAVRKGADTASVCCTVV